MVLSTHPSATAQVGRALTNMGCTISTKQVAEDLGISTAGGHRRAVASVNKRLEKGRKRAIGVASLVNTDKRARKLYLTGVNPMQSYDSPAMGASPTALLRLRRNAVKAINPPGHNGSTTSILAWHIGIDADPGIKELLRQLALWIDLRSSFLS